MRRVLVLPLLVLAPLAAPASAQVYDRYGGGNSGYAMPPAYAQAPPRILNWSGKQTQPAPQMAMPPPGYGYPQQAYPQGYSPQAGYGYPQQGYYPSIQTGYPQQQPQPAPPGYVAPGQMPTYEQMQQQRMQQQQVVQGPQPFPIMNTPPQGAWAYQPGAYPQPYPQQPYPAQPYPQPGQAYAAPAAYAPPQAQFQPQPQPQQFPAQAYPQAVQPAMAAPAASPRPADPTVTAAPTTPVQSAPLPTNIYAPAPPRADLPADGQPPASGGGATALASLGVRHYSVHRPFGMSPDPAPVPPADNQVVIAAPETEIVDNSDIGLRGVGMDQDDAPRKKRSDD